MGSGLPTIGTGASGNLDFMNHENSILIPAQMVDVPEQASREIQVYEGCMWFEPNLAELKTAMRAVFVDSELCDRLGRRARADIVAKHSVDVGCNLWEAAVKNAEQRFIVPSISPPSGSQIKVVWEGELFSGHSFSNINEQLTGMFMDDNRFALAIDRKIYNPTYDYEHTKPGKYLAHANRQLDDSPDVIVRHSFPPNWTPPEQATWVHIQPWEFSHLPLDWIEPLQNNVDEIWAPSNYVKRVYVNSGVAEKKIRVIPWGVDSRVFNPDVPSRFLPTKKSFRFVFVGGTIQRKGYDRVLQAYLEEFSPDEDVCLVVKDMGAETFYRYFNLRNETLRARDDPQQPEILYFENRWTMGQLAGLYTACNCLLLPYRGEGFGLTVLEAMACGIPAIVPRGGSSDDFVTDETGFLLNSRLVETRHEWPLVGPALELDVNIAELRETMRHAFNHRDLGAAKGKRAAGHVARNLTWENTYRQMSERIIDLAAQGRHISSMQASSKSKNGGVTACIRTQNDERVIANCISRLLPFVDKVLIIDSDSSDRTAAIAKEYGALVISNSQSSFDGDSTIPDVSCVLANNLAFLGRTDVSTR